MANLNQLELNLKLAHALTIGTAADVQAAIDAGGQINLTRTEFRSVFRQYFNSYGKGDRPEILDVLVQNGANINEEYDDITPIMEAARCGYVESVKKLIDLGADINYTPGYKGNALVKALMQRQMVPYETTRQIVNTLLDNGIEVNGRTADVTPLMLAVEHQDLELVERLIQMGADVDAMDKENVSALTIAKRQGNKKIIEVLRKAGAHDGVATHALAKEAVVSTSRPKVDEEKFARLIADDADVNYNGGEALHAVVHAGHKGIVRRLLDKGADVNAAGYDGRTPLMTARTTDMMALLLDRGANINAQDGNGLTKLHQEALDRVNKPLLDNIRFLLEQGAKVDIRDKKGNTPLMTIVSDFGKDRFEITTALLAHKANPNLKGEGGLTPLAQAVHRRDSKMAKLLIQHGAKPNVKDGKGLTPMDVAIHYHSAEMVDILRDAGVKISTKKMDDVARAATGFMSYDTINQALQKEILKEKNDEMVKFLIALGADVNLPDEKGMTPLAVTVSLNRAEIVESLLQHGADVNAQNNAGKTAVHVAAQLGKMESLRSLIAHNADLNVADAEGKTPVHTAVQYAQTDALKVLINGGADVFARDNAGTTALGMVKNKATREALRVAGANNIFKRARSKMAYVLRDKKSR